MRDLEGVIVATVSNPNTGLSPTSLEPLFYGDGKPETASNPKERLLGWEVTDSEEIMDEFSFTLENGDLKLFDSKLLAKGNKVKFRFGQPTRLSPTFEGIITSRTGWRTLQIGGQFTSELAISNKQVTEKFLKKSLSQIATELFEREGFNAVVDDTKIVLPVVIRSDETVLQFLKRKALDAGGAYEVYMENNTGFFVKKKLEKRPAIILRYGTERNDADYVTLGEPQFKDIQENVATEETVKGFDLMNKKPIEEKANNDTSKQTSLGEGTFYFDESAGTRKFRPAGAQRSAETGKSKPTSKQTNETAKAVADSEFDSKNAKAYELTWKIVGDATVKAKTVAQVDVESKTISGKWYIKQVRHSSPSGTDFETEISMISNALGGTAPGTVTATPAGGTNTTKPDPDASQKVTYVFDENAGTRVPKGLL